MAEDTFSGDARIERLRESVLRGAERGSLCLSGGAKGCDLLWGKAAVDGGMQALHWSFDGHRTRAVEAVHGRLCRLSKATLELAAPTMEAVARRIQRRLSHQPHVRPLLLRDLFQVAWSDSVYAVSRFKPDGMVDGGTAWAMDAFRMRGRGVAYLFCQEAGRWHASVDGGEWFSLDEEDVPVPEGVWAGIGTREPEPEGVGAIERMSARMRPTPPAPPTLR